MKKILLGLVISSLVGFLSLFNISSTFAAATTQVSSYTKNAIRKYKQQNYTGAIQDCNIALNKNSKDSIAQYYKAISYVRIGEKEKALEAYKKVYETSQNQTLITFAKRGEMCLNDPEKCGYSEATTKDLETFIQSGQMVSKDVKKSVRTQKLNEIKDEMNSYEPPSKTERAVPLPSNTTVNTDRKSDASINQPSDKEIADAVRTLAKVGINPLAGMNNGMPMMNSSSDNMIPYIMSQNGNGQVDPQVIQTMLMSQMVTDFGFGITQ